MLLSEEDLSSKKREADGFPRVSFSGLDRTCVFRAVVSATVEAPAETIFIFRAAGNLCEEIIAEFNGCGFEKGKRFLL